MSAKIIILQVPPEPRNAVYACVCGWEGAACSRCPECRALRQPLPLAGKVERKSRIGADKNR